MTGPAHRPVLLKEAVDGLAIRPDGNYVDGTFGRGGHAAAILDRLGPSGRLLAIDKDPEAVALARERFGNDDRFAVREGSFAMLEQEVGKQGLAGRMDGILLDLGVSSPQLEDPGRGFSFRLEGPLDMRMAGEAGGETAADWLDRAAEAEIADVIRRYGEDRFARRIARAIVRAREEEPIRTTSALAEVVAEAVPRRFHERGKHPATRTFQAIRIHLNRELEDLRAVLEQSVRVLGPGGRLSVISFHSLEDRIVKRFMRDHSRPDPRLDHLPVLPPEAEPELRLIGRAVKPDAREREQNPRARSAILRIAERRPE